MELAQAANAIPSSNSLSTALGITPNEALAAILVMAIIAIGFWAIVKYNDSGSFRNTNGLVGSKGGRVKRVVTEYEDVEPEKI